MYKFKAELINQATNDVTVEKSNNMATLLKLVNQASNVAYRVVSSQTNKVIMQGNK